MKTLLLSFLLFCCASVHAQYYYIDIIGSKESTEMLKNYRNNKVSRVLLKSFDATDTRNEDFYVEQVYQPAEQVLKTITRSSSTDASVLLTYSDAEGRIVKTVDSSDNLVSITSYGYDNNGRLTTIKSNSSDTAKKLNETEEHLWMYNGNVVDRMLRIKNGIDTTYVSFKIDNGNVVEEQSLRKGVKSDPVYYYYDAQNRLTDIVRFNNKARRLLPEYMFEYSPANQVIQKITVPSNGSNYLIWRYQYDASGLKTKEAIYDRHKSLTGKIEYQYQRG